MACVLPLLGLRAGRDVEWTGVNFLFRIWNSFQLRLSKPDVCLGQGKTVYF